MSAPPESLPDFIDEVPTSEKTLLLLNRTGPEPLATLLKNAFVTQDVTVAERQVPNGTDDLICLIDEGRVVTTSPFEALEASFLLVNVVQPRQHVGESLRIDGPCPRPISIDVDQQERRFERFER